VFTLDIIVLFRPYFAMYARADTWVCPYSRKGDIPFQITENRYQRPENSFLVLELALSVL
jgi:hypothetical protein